MLRSTAVQSESPLHCVLCAAYVRQHYAASLTWGSRLCKPSCSLQMVYASFLARLCMPDRSCEPLETNRQSQRAHDATPQTPWLVHMPADLKIHLGSQRAMMLCLMWMNADCRCLCMEWILIQGQSWALWGQRMTFGRASIWCIQGPGKVPVCIRFSKADLYQARATLNSGREKTV